MSIVDEAHRFCPKTFSEIRDIFDVLGIAVVLVGTDRLDAVVRREEVFGFVFWVDIWRSLEAAYRTTYQTTVCPP